MMMIRKLDYSPLLNCDLAVNAPGNLGLLLVHLLSIWSNRRGITSSEDDVVGMAWSEEMQRTWWMRQGLFREQ